MIKIKDIPKYERPIERILNNDPSILSNEELISILLHTGYKNYSVKPFELPCSDILSAEYESRLTEGVHRCIYKSLNAARGAVSGNNKRTEGID